MEDSGTKNPAKRIKIKKNDVMNDFRLIMFFSSLHYSGSFRIEGYFS